MPSKFTVNFQNMKKLFNLGLHLNNKKSVFFTQDERYIRFGNPAIIRNPKELLMQMQGLTKIIARFLQNNEKIIIINTDPMYTGYAEFFEGINIRCYEEPWAPGTLTNAFVKDISNIPQEKTELNPFSGLQTTQQTSLLVLVSASVQDRRIILTEIQSTNLPVINLTGHSIRQALYNLHSFPNRNYVYFYLQLFYHLIQKHQKKNILNQTTTIFEETKVNYLEQNVALFQELKREKKLLYQLPL